MSDRSDDVPDVATAPDLAARGVDAEDSGGLESQILLARARQKLLGWNDTPATIGRYRVIERIGEGGMGVVFAAHDDELDRVVAIKILRSELAPGSAGRQRLVREAQATARLSHPNVVHVYEVGQQGDHVYMAMELVRGQTLRAWQTTSRPWTEIVAIYRRVGEGLVAAHAEGIVHRDFKPDNVLVGSEQRPQIVDFGLARASGDTGAFPEVGHTSGSGPTWRDLDITGTGTVLGTPAYMAPEQLHRAKPDARCDQFSFCVALFEALYGRRPFAGSTYTQLADALEAGTTIAVADRRGVPEAMHAIVLRGLAHEPGDRFASMRELLDALEQASRPRPKSARTGIAVAGVAAIAALGWALVPHAAAPTEAAAAMQSETPAIDPWVEIVAASELPPLVPTPLEGDPTGVTVHRLRNGLTIYLAHRPTEPLVTMMLAIRAGAAEEGEHRGLAPLVREAVQRGTARLGVTDAVAERSLLVAQHQLIDALPSVRDPAARAQLLQTIAASEQASATYEIPGEMYEATLALGGLGAPVLGGHGAVYSTRVPSNRVGAWLAMASEMVQHPVFRGFLGETASQLEMMTAYDAEDPAGRARAPLFAAATGVQIGGEATLTSLAEVPLAAARKFHHELYRPNNTALVMIGDITAEQAIRLAEQQLGDWEPAPLPRSRVVDEPLAQPRIVQDTVGQGGDAIEMVWTLPPWGTPEYAQLAQLEFVLGGSHGLLSALGSEVSRGWGAFVGSSRDFIVIGFPAPGVTNDALEQATLANLRAVAEGRVDDALWDAALAEAQLERASWARGPSSLASAIADSFMSRRDWASASRGLMVVPPTRDEVKAAAKMLLARPLIVSRRTEGEPPAIDAPQLPSLPNLPAATRGRSAFVDEIVGAPAYAMEPRFLVAGSSFEASAHGSGRVITSKNDGPLFWLTWIYPVGLAENQWACDSAHARLPGARVAGARISLLCTTADTRVSVMAPASRFAEVMPKVSKWLREETVAVDPRYLTATLHSREMQRSTSFLRARAAEAWALLGEHAMDASAPRDEDLHRLAKREIPRALHELQRYDADVLYVGPDPDAVREWLPPVRNATSAGPPLRRYRAIAAPEVLVMDDPTRDDVVVRAMVPWIATTPREQLAAQIHHRVAGENEVVAPFPVEEDHEDHQVPWSPGPPLAIDVALRVQPQDVVAGLQAASAALRGRPASDQLDRLHRELEVEFRARRPAPQHIPDLVYAWPETDVDPRVAQWMALPSLSATDVAAYYDRVDATIPALLVVGDVRKLDLAALAKLGKVVRLDPAEIMFDTGQSFHRDTSALLDE